MSIRIWTGSEFVVAERNSDGSYEVKDISDMLRFKAKNLNAQADSELYEVAADLCAAYDGLAGDDDNTLEYKGFKTVAHLRLKEGVIGGKVLGIRDSVQWSTDDIEHVEYAFHVTVDELLRTQGE